MPEPAKLKSAKAVSGSAAEVPTILALRTRWVWLGRPSGYLAGAALAERREAMIHRSRTRLFGHLIELTDMSSIWTGWVKSPAKG